MSLCVLCRGCLRLPTNCPSTACPSYGRPVRCWTLAELNWTEQGACLCGWCTFVARWIVLWASLSGIGVPWVSMPVPTNVALMPRVASQQSANPLWLLECGLVNVSWWSSKQSQRDCTLLLSFVFGCIAFVRVSCSVSNDNS